MLARVNTDISVAELQTARYGTMSATWRTRTGSSTTPIATWTARLLPVTLPWKPGVGFVPSTKRIAAAARRRKEAQAREQYFRFEEEVQDALTGRIVDGTQTGNGSRAGTFRGTGGVQVSERRLRLLMGIPITDGRLIRPTDEPMVVPTRFDWSQVVADALSERAELREQRWRVKMRQLEVKANRNFLLPRLDVVGRYRWRGLGQTLLDPTWGQPEFDNAYQTLMSGDYQEWQLGVELTVPIGHRRAHMAVRNSQLNLARERAVLKEQERVILHDLSNGVSEVERAEAVVGTTYNRRVAAAQQLAAVQAAYDADKAPLDLVLEGQRRRADAESRHHRARVEYALAIKNVHYDKGTLLDYYRIYMAEGAWPTAAYHDAAQRRALAVRPCIDYRLHRPLTVSSASQQTIMPGEPTVDPLPPVERVPDPGYGQRSESVQPRLVPLPDVRSSATMPASLQASPATANYLR